eukprot:360718-Chlamydomonas_euryale.AAC.4
MGHAAGGVEKRYCLACGGTDLCRGDGTPHGCADALYPHVSPPLRCMLGASQELFSGLLSEGKLMLSVALTRLPFFPTFAACLVPHKGRQQAPHKRPLNSSHELFSGLLSKGKLMGCFSAKRGRADVLHRSHLPLLTLALCAPQELFSGLLNEGELMSFIVSHLPLLPLALCASQELFSGLLNEGELMPFI